MTRTEIEIELRKGRTLDSILHFRRGQGCMIFKADKFQPGDEVLYIPDIDMNEIHVDKDISVDIEGIYDVLGCCYTGDDFIETCNGDEKRAEMLFWYCDWQHPSSAYDEGAVDDDDEETEEHDEYKIMSEIGTYNAGDDLYIVTENSAGEIYSIRCKYALDLINDWHGECDFCPPNDARVFFACWNSEPFNPHKYTDFESLVENVLIPKFGR